METTIEPAHPGRALTPAARIQAEHFEQADPRCRSLQLPEGVLLRYAALGSLYFYLRSGVDDGKIVTAVHASDSPYERHKALIGEVRTPMFEPHADARHLAKVEKLVRAWVDFVGEPDPADAFLSFPLKRPG
jgi:hypothetical protein